MTTHLCDHVVDEPVLVPDALGHIVSLVFSLVDLLENIFKHAVVDLQDCVLSAQV